MEQRIINKRFLVSVIKNGKVVDLLSGKSLDGIKCVIMTKYKGCATEIMEYEEEKNVSVASLKDHFLMIRRRTTNNLFK